MQPPPMWLDLQPTNNGKWLLRFSVFQIIQVCEAQNWRSLLESRPNVFKKTSTSSAAHGNRHLDENKYAGVVKASSIPFSAFSCNCSCLNLLPSENSYRISAVRSVVDVSENSCTVPPHCHSAAPCFVPGKSMTWIWKNNTVLIS